LSFILQPLALFALLSLPLILYLHLYRRQPKTKTVSSLFLWSAKGQEYSAGRKKQPLHRSLSFWLEILAATLLSIALSQPVGCDRSGTHTVLIIDSSASMNAEQSWIQHKESWISRIRSESNQSTFTIIRAGRSASILSGPNSSAEEAIQRLDSL